MLTIYDYAAILFYLFFTASLGFVFKRLNVGGTDYFAGGRKMNWWLLGASSFVSNFSAWAFTGAAGMAYSYGVLVFSITMLNVVGFLISYFWFAGKFRRLRLVTAMDAVRLRFGRGSEQLFTWLQILTSFFGGAVWLVGLSILVSTVFGFPQVPVIIFCTITITFMTLLGGKWAVSGSDFIQTLLLSVISIVVLVLTFYHVGGVSAMIEKIPSGHWRFFQPLGSITYDWLYVTTALIWGIYQTNSVLFGAAKYIAAKDDRHAKKSVLVPLIGYLFLPVAWFLPSMAATVIVPDLIEKYAAFNNPAEAAYIAVCIKVLPQGLLGLVIAGFFAATMSSMDTSLNVNAGFLVKNFYQPVFRKNASETEQLAVGHIATIFCGALMMCLAIMIVTRGKVSLFDAYLYLNAYIQAPLTVALFLSIMVHRTPAWSGWTTVLVGIFSTVLIYDVVPLEPVQVWLTRIFGAGFASYLVTNKFTFTNILTIPLCSIYFLCTRYFFREIPRNQEYRENLGEFKRRLDAPVSFDDEIGGDNTAQQARIMGVLALIYGGFISLGVFIPNPISGRLSIAACASVLIGTGALLLMYGRRVRHRIFLKG
jgi:SSS family solute:Na+ symporter